MYFSNPNGSKVVINGIDNEVYVHNQNSNAKILIKINGDGNKINIGRCIISDFKINMGSNQRITGEEVSIGDNCSIEPGGIFDIFTDFAKIKIGNNCMLSRNIYLRYGENPHLIFDLNTGEYLDGDGGIDIGDKVWIGEGVFLSKRTVINDESIVAAKSVVTRKFNEKNCIIAGNPATIVKKDIQWFRNRQHIPNESKYEISIKEYDNLIKNKSNSV